MNSKATLLKREQVTENCYALTFNVGEDFYFNAGQYIWLILPLGRRAYSIVSSSTNKSVITVLVKYIPGSQFINKLLSLNNGSLVEFRGPCGGLRIPEENTYSIYIAGGVGIAPFLSIIRSLRENKIQRDILLLYFSQTERDAIYIDELTSYTYANHGFKFTTVYGKVEEPHFLEIFSKQKNVYVIGSKEFVNVVDKIIRKLKLSYNTLTYEENFPETQTIPLDLNDTSIFKKVVDQSANHVVITDANGVIVYANQSAQTLTGFSFEEMKNQTPRLWGGLMEPTVYKNFWDTIKLKRKPFKGELRNIRKDGVEYDVLATVSPILDSQGDLLGFMGIEEDITKAKTNQVELKRITDLMLDKYSHNEDAN